MKLLQSIFKSFFSRAKILLILAVASSSLTTLAAGFSDNFSGDLSYWTPYANGGTWTIQNGYLIANYDISCGSNACPQSDLILNDGYQPSGDWAASVEFNHIQYVGYPQYDVSAVAFALWKDANNKINVASSISATGDVTMQVANWNGQWSEIKSVTLAKGLDPALPHTATLAKTGASYKLYIDGIYIDGFTDTFLNGTGKIGLHTYGTKKLDNFWIQIGPETKPIFFSGESPAVTLVVTKAGTGSGTVSSSPTGIDCGATCNANYASGTSVTLTATPAAGSSFGGWSGGGCSGTGSCLVSMSAAQSVTASFALGTGGMHVTINQVDGSSCPRQDVYVSVLNAANNPVTGLTAGAFGLYQAGVSVPFTFSTVGGGASNVSVVLTMDYSGSMSSVTGTEETAAVSFINQMAASDAAEIIKFGASVEVQQTFTTDKTSLIKAVQSNAYSGDTGNTSFFDAAYKGLQDIQTRSGRRAIVAMTDGWDGNSSHTLADVIALAQSLGVPVFTIGLGSADTTMLQSMATQTGGTYYYAPTAADLQAVYQAISHVLNNQYMLSFAGAQDGLTHSIEVRVSSGADSGSQTRTYTACPPGAPIATLTPSAGLTFASHALNTTSAAQTATLSNTGTAALTISFITTSGDFAKASTTCGTSLAAGASCTIAITFTPTAASTRTGTLSVTDNASGSPQTLSLTGTAAALIPQTISFTNPGTNTLGSAPFTLSATGGASGNPVTFTSQSNSICTVSASTVTLVAAGTCTIAANQAANGSYSAAPQVLQSFTVLGLISQTISFTNPGAKTFGAATFDLSATGGASGNPVTFTSQTMGVCTVSGSTVTLVATGTCTIAANQSGNASYAAAIQVTQSITVSAAPSPVGAGPYDGIYQWSSGNYLSLHQDGTHMIATIYFNADGSFSFPATSGAGVLQVPQLDIFDLMNGQVTGSTVRMNGTRFHRACNVTYDFTFNNDATITVTRVGVSNAAVADSAGISCSAIVGAEPITLSVPKIRFNLDSAPVANVGLYDGIYQWSVGNYVSLHQDGTHLIGTIYFNADGSFSFPATSGAGVLQVPQLDIFDLMNGQVVGSTVRMNGTRFHRACNVSYDFTFNNDASITVTRIDVSNTAAAYAGGIFCSAIVGAEPLTLSVPKIRFN